MKRILSLIALALLLPTLALAQMHISPSPQPQLQPSNPPINLVPQPINPGYQVPQYWPTPLPQVPQPINPSYQVPQRQLRCTTTYNQWTRSSQTICD